jgi:predicted DNA-binding transcriptional regulator YafY
MSHSRSIYRTIKILKRLNDGQRLCVSLLATEYEVSDRTIRRDFELIREIFGDFLTKEGDCYQGYKRVLLGELMEASELLVLSNIVRLFDSVQKSSKISDKTKALIEQSNKVYDFKSRPFESLENIDIVKKLEHAISFNKEIKVVYQTQEHPFYLKFLPYKIIFLSENFYLVGVNVKNRLPELRRVSMIKELEFSSKSFKKDANIERFFENLQTPWSVYNTREVEVILRVNKSIKRYFIRKKYLPSQKIGKEFDDGSLEVKYQITNYREIEDIVLKWLPKVEIIQPRRLKKHIKRAIKKKLGGLTSSL